MVTAASLVSALIFRRPLQVGKENVFI